MSCKTREICETLIGPPAFTRYLCFSPDGRTIVIGGEDSAVRRWDIATRRPLSPPLQHRGPIRAVAFSPDGESILTGSWDTTAQLWDAATGLPLGPPLPHSERVWAVAFSFDGERVLTGSADKTARLFRKAPELPDDLERIATWVEVRTGLAVDPQGSIQVLDHAADDGHLRRQRGPSEVMRREVQ